MHINNSFSCSIYPSHSLPQHTKQIANAAKFQLFASIPLLHPSTADPETNLFHLYKVELFYVLLCTFCANKRFPNCKLFLERIHHLSLFSSKYVNLVLFEQTASGTRWVYIESTERSTYLCSYNILISIHQSSSSLPLDKGNGDMCTTHIWKASRRGKGGNCVWNGWCQFHFHHTHIFGLVAMTTHACFSSAGLLTSTTHTIWQKARWATFENVEYRVVEWLCVYSLKKGSRCPDEAQRLRGARRASKQQ